VSARILVIEDNPANLELMNYLLAAFGHTVLTADDGRKGVEAARREHPDLIVCDVQLPDMDGHEVARWLKSAPDLRAIPLVAVTALAMVGDRDKVLASGFDGYLAKPINPETFVSQVETYLRLEKRSTAATHSVPAPQATASCVEGATILVVDNLPLNLELARSLLEPFGYRVVTAERLAEGLDVLRRERCDLILSDVCMSNENGYDFIRAVRADAWGRDIPFVFITSTMVEEKERQKGLALGAARFLFRPIEPEVFLAEIRACLREKERSAHGYDTGR
jgi:two-component system, cell cycle response regulator